MFTYPRNRGTAVPHWIHEIKHDGIASRFIVGKRSTVHAVSPLSAGRVRCDDMQDAVLGWWTSRPFRLNAPGLKRGSFFWPE